MIEMTVLEARIKWLRLTARREQDVRERISIEDEIAFLEDIHPDLEIFIAPKANYA